MQDWLRVRSGPGTTYSVVDFLGPKEKVEILEQKTVGATQWGKIASGWISMDYVILDKPNSDSGTSATTQTGKVTATELLIRSGPGTTYSIVGYLTQGAPVTITERKTNGAMEWGKIPNGWISLTYVKLDTAENGGTTTEKPSDTVTGTVNVQEWLRVRSGPGTSYSVAGYLKPNEKVTITERRTVGSTVWGKISQGWVSLDYIILDKDASSGDTTQKVTKTIIADCLRVRRGPGLENAIVGYLYYGAKVEILETANDSDGDTWGRIANGWIYLGYTK